MNYRNKQQGVVLVIALIALVAISLAGVALIRSVDTSNVVSGNIAFNEAAIQMADIGAETAYAEIYTNRSSNPNSCLFMAASCPQNSAGNSYFYPNFSTIDSVSKLPTPSGGLFWSDPQEILMPGETAGNGTYQVQYVTERMCQGTGSGSPLQYSQSAADQATFAACNAAPSYDINGNPVYGDGKLFFRITVQVTGPRNTRGLAQYFYGLPNQVVN